MQNGNRRFEIRLDPPELGRVEIRMDVTRDGQVTTHLVVERSETLDLLQRDARALERALQNAGLDTSEGGLKFSLKDQGEAHDMAGDDQADKSGLPGDADDSADEMLDTPIEALAHGRNYVANSGLDIRI